MNKNKLLLSLTTLALVQAMQAAHAADAADANAGKTFFRTQCGLCHSAEPNDNGGAQGPSLQGIFGRAAAGNDAFSYTEALRSANLTWDAATLDRFLASPTTVVPGSAMVVPVPGAADRANVIAYFEALGTGSFQEAGPAQRGGGGGRAAPEPISQANADWHNDKPGRVHRVDLNALPAPYATQSASNFPRLVPKPADAVLQVPEGFKVDVFASGLTGPRAMIVAANGDVILAETQAGRITILRPSADGSTAASTSVFAQGLLQPNGLAFYPSRDNPQWLYVAETNRIVRYPFHTGDTTASAVPEVVVPQLSNVGGGHYTRDIAFSLDGKRMFVSVGSQSNVAEEMSKKSVAEAQAWDQAHGIIGAAWDQEEGRAGVQVFEVGSNAPGKLFATGIRNCVGLTVQPATGALWCTTNERDMLGDDLVPDYSTRVQEGGYYGWPWYYMGNYEEPRHAGERPDLAGKALRPDVPYTAHSAALDLEFYPASQSGASAFPAEYAGDGFAVLHGSWNRGPRTGHKVVQVPMQNGEPTGEYIDFLTGFIGADGNPFGRPAAIAVAQDGSLLLSDDGANVLYRISYGN
jgi:glucose/arabinose dehydrogenase/cytochrome c2